MGRIINLSAFCKNTYEGIYMINKNVKENNVNINKWDISREKKIEIEKKVEQILDKSNYKKTDIIDIVSFVKDNGFVVQKADLPINTTGYLVVNDDDPIDETSNTHRLIVVNNEFKNPDNEKDVRQKKSRFITAHEYGHFILHKRDNKMYAHRDSDKRKTPEELEADYFARSILMPAKPFLSLSHCLDILIENPNNTDIHSKKVEFLSSYFNVTRNKVIKRLGDIEVLNSINA